jgi:hypothetical protein
VPDQCTRGLLFDPPNQKSQTYLLEAAMKIVLGLSSLVLLYSTLMFAQERPTIPPSPLVFTHVTVIDATGAPAQPDMSA